MYMFDLNRRPILWAIIKPIQIKHVHSSVSYQQATGQKNNQQGHESLRRDVKMPHSIITYTCRYIYTISHKKPFAPGVDGVVLL